MKKMQVLQPEMNKIKAKHKEDPRLQQQELMKLYQSENVNPVGGCLPVLIQR